ncbi:MAG TPA: S8 family serine peptidase, partial [Sandaracinaceae bacterium]
RAVRATGRLFAGERSAVDVHVPRSPRDDAFVALTVRASGALAIEAPDGTRAPLSLAPSSIALPGARAFVEPVEDDDAWRVRLAAHGGALAPGTYRLHVEGPSTFEVWLAGARLGATFFAPSLGGPHVRDDEAITIPATASGLIAVGATIARPRIETDRTLEFEGAPGEPASYSSLGPAPSGAPKPDLAAPGGWILAALSAQVRDGDPDNLTGGALAGLRAPDGRIAVRGTSAAAAVVAGALLLALELDPSRGPDARALLVASARGDGAWSPAEGAGELDVPRLLALWSGGRDERSGAWMAATRPFAPFDDALWIAVRARGAPSTIELAVGGETHLAPLSFGTAQLALPPPPVEVGAPLRIEASIDGSPLGPIDVPVVLERGRRGAVSVGGGCAIARRDGGARGVLATLGALAAILRRRPRKAHSFAPGSTLSKTTLNERT